MPRTNSSAPPYRKRRHRATGLGVAMIGSLLAFAACSDQGGSTDVGGLGSSTASVGSSSSSSSTTTAAVDSLVSIERTVDDPDGWSYDLTIEVSKPTVAVVPDGKPSEMGVNASWTTEVTQTPSITDRASPILSGMSLHAFYRNDGLCRKPYEAPDYTIAGQPVCNLYTIDVDRWAGEEDITSTVTSSATTERSWVLDRSEAETMQKLVEQRPIYWVLTAAMSGSDSVEYTVCRDKNHHVMGVFDGTGSLISKDQFTAQRQESWALETHTACTFSIVNGVATYELEFGKGS